MQTLWPPRQPLIVSLKDESQTDKQLDSDEPNSTWEAPAAHARGVLSYAERLAERQSALQARAWQPDLLASSGGHVGTEDASLQQFDASVTAKSEYGTSDLQQRADTEAIAPSAAVVQGGSLATRTCAVAGATGFPGTVLSLSIDGNLLGLGRSTDPPGLPFPVNGAQPSMRYVGAGGHSIAVDADGTLWTWGRNDSAGGGGHGSPAMEASGQLGGSRRTVQSPLDAAPLTSDQTFVAADAGRYHSAAVTADGRVVTWGLNDFGQLGRSAHTAEGTPCTSGATCHSASLEAASSSDDSFGTEEVVAVASGRYHTVVATRSGAVYTSGLNFCGNGQVLTCVRIRALLA